MSMRQRDVSYRPGRMGDGPKLSGFSVATGTNQRPQRPQRSRSGTRGFWAGTVVPALVGCEARRCTRKSKAKGPSQTLFRCLTRDEGRGRVTMSMVDMGVDLGRGRGRETTGTQGGIGDGWIMDGRMGQRRIREEGRLSLREDLGPALAAHGSLRHSTC